MSKLPSRPGSPSLPTLCLTALWDDGLGVAIVTHPRGLTLATAEDVASWREEVFSKLERILQERGNRFPIVVCVDGVTIHPRVAEEYATVVKQYTERFASAVSRYADQANGVGPLITAVALSGGYRANLCRSRAEAVQHALAGASADAPATTKKSS